MDLRFDYFASGQRSFEEVIGRLQYWLISDHLLLCVLLFVVVIRVSMDVAYSLLRCLGRGFSDVLWVYLAVNRCCCFIYRAICSAFDFDCLHVICTLDSTKQPKQMGKHAEKSNRHLGKRPSWRELCSVPARPSAAQCPQNANVSHLYSAR